MKTYRSTFWFGTDRKRNLLTEAITTNEDVEELRSKLFKQVKKPKLPDYSVLIVTRAEPGATQTGFDFGTGV